MSRTTTRHVHGLRWTCDRPGRSWTTVVDGQRWELERRTRSRAEPLDTGWYLFGPSLFGDFMAARFGEAAREAASHIEDSAPRAQPGRRSKAGWGAEAVSRDTTRGPAPAGRLRWRSG